MKRKVSIILCVVMLFTLMSGSVVSANSNSILISYIQKPKKQLMK